MVKYMNGYFDLLSPEIEAMILDQLCMPDLAIFSQTRIQNQLGITDYIDNRHNNLLNQFITNIPLFIDLLECTGSVISGSSAVNLILPKSEEFKIDDMDIYTTEKYAEVVIEYLKKEESYEVNKDSNERQNTTTTQ
ncbi:hypothetical protein BD769DRAFT_1664575 [Suillus cothurnatus]|nr:hypothetical protein BD769DRAFT_1664575 [Suillus cothurnatus]